MASECRSWDSSIRVVSVRSSIDKLSPLCLSGVSTARPQVADESSSANGHRDTGEPGHVGHVHPRQAGLADLPPGPAPGPLLDGDLALHAGQGRAETTVDAVPEADVDALAPIDVEPVRLVELPLVTGRRTGQEEHRDAGRNRAPLERRLANAETSLVLRRGPIAQHLLDGRHDAGGIGEDL